MPLPVAAEYPIPGATVITTLAHDGQSFVICSTILAPTQINAAPNSSVPEIHIRGKTDAEAGVNSSTRWTESFKVRLENLRRRLAAKEGQQEEAAPGGGDHEADMVKEE